MPPPSQPKPGQCYHHLFQPNRRYPPH
jgi:hypothetical protein